MENNMSAYVCDDRHINAIINFAVNHRVSFRNPETKERVFVVPKNASEIGQILRDENVRSVNYRYSKQDQAARFSYVYDPVKIVVPVQALKALNCLDYQSCETPDWEASLAWRIVQEISGYAVRKLPGYDAAQWDIDV
jgi:hypothetical protein